MIFVTVGTHEQPFDRLVKEVDRLKGENLIRDEVFIQTGYSLYKPQACEYRDFIPFDEMMRRITESEVVITHGGTGSIMLVLFNQKIPVVVPRQKRYREHVDNHQVLFCKTLESKKRILAVYETVDLREQVVNYHDRVQELQKRENQGKTHLDPGLSAFNDRENVTLFARRLNDICRQLVNAL